MWSNHLLELGSGMVPGSGRIIDYQDPYSILFTGVSVSASDGFDADWVFTRNAGESTLTCLALQTNF